MDGIVSAVDRVQTVCSSVIEQTTDMRITHRNARLVRRKLRDIDKWKTSAQKVDAILQSKQYKQLDPAISVLLHAEAFLDDPDCPLPLHQQRSLATDITAAKAHASTWYLQHWSKYCQSMSTLNAARIEQAALVPETAIHICPSTHHILMSDGSTRTTGGFTRMMDSTANMAQSNSSNKSSDATSIPAPTPAAPTAAAAAGAGVGAGAGAGWGWGWGWAWGWRERASAAAMRASRWDRGRGRLRGRDRVRARNRGP